MVCTELGRCLQSLQLHRFGGKVTEDELLLVVLGSVHHTGNVYTEITASFRLLLLLFLNTSHNQRLL